MAALEIRKLERRGSSPAELVELFACKESGGVSLLKLANAADAR